MPAEVSWADPKRKSDFEQWLAPLTAAHGLRPATLRAASADASFRRYLRIDADKGISLVVMDAPPPQEDVRPFVKIAQLIEQAGLHGPHVLAADVERGFLLLTDLGRTLYLDAFADASPKQADTLMRDAIAALVQWQAKVPGDTLPPYDDAMLRRELQLFPDWCVVRECGVTWGAREQKIWQQVSDALVAAALAQPKVAVHRDWMPRNLMVSDPNPAILDFQDAAYGPIAYDVASLLRDAFWSWDEEREIDWAARYWDKARRAALPVGDDFGLFWRDVRVDRPAAPLESAGHLLPPEAPRRQAEIFERLAALFCLCNEDRDALPPTRAAGRTARAAVGDEGSGGVLAALKRPHSTLPIFLTASVISAASAFQ